MPHGHGAKFPRKKQEAIAALLRCRTLEDAAEETAISSKTLRRWLEDPDFFQQYHEARISAYGHAMATMQSASERAASTILDILNDSRVPTASRLRAASIILEYSKSASESDDLKLRVANLEKLVEKKL